MSGENNTIRDSVELLFRPYFHKHFFTNKLLLLSETLHIALFIPHTVKLQLVGNCSTYPEKCTFICKGTHVY